MPRRYQRGQRNGLMPSRPREFLFCPHCGEDLEALRPRKIGDLWADPRGDTYWKGSVVLLNETDRLLLHSLLTVRDFQATRDVDRGHFVDALVIAERAGIAVDSVNVRLSNLRMAFRSVDPSFDHIENERGLGYRWRSHEKAPASLARSRKPPGRFALWDDGQLIIGHRVRVWLNPKEVGGMLKIVATLIRADGDWVTREELAKAAGLEPKSVTFVMRSLRKRLAQAREAGDHGAEIRVRSARSRRFGMGGFRLCLKGDVADE